MWSHSVALPPPPIIAANEERQRQSSAKHSQALFTYVETGGLPPPFEEPPRKRSECVLALAYVVLIALFVTCVLLLSLSSDIKSKRIPRKNGRLTAFEIPTVQ